MQAVLRTPFFTRFGAARLRGIVTAVASALALSACSMVAGHRADVSGESAGEISQASLRTAELETEIAQLKAKNAELEKQLTDLQAASAKDEDSAATEFAEAQETAQNAPAQPAVRPETVVAAAEVNTALADAPAKPVQPSPRLVQPTFASGQETVFENEAETTAIKVSSVLYGVHLASYRTEDSARAGWRKLQRENPDELGLLEPRVETITIEGRGDFIRLIGGGFSSQDRAESLCATLKAKGVYCSVVSFGGERLSLVDTPGD